MIYHQKIKEPKARTDPPRSALDLDFWISYPGNNLVGLFS